MATPILTSWRHPDGTIDTAEITEQVLELAPGCELIAGDWELADPAGNDGRHIYHRVEPLWDAGPACRICGCTQENACEGGCSWVDDPLGLGPLCSTCEPVAKIISVLKVDDLTVGDVVVLRTEFHDPPAMLMALAHHLHRGDTRGDGPLVVQVGPDGDLRILDEDQMRQAGWVRRPPAGVAAPPPVEDERWIVVAPTFQSAFEFLVQRGVDPRRSVTVADMRSAGRIRGLTPAGQYHLEVLGYPERTDVADEIRRQLIMAGWEIP